MKHPCFRLPAAGLLLCLVALPAAAAQKPKGANEHAAPGTADAPAPVSSIRVHGKPTATERLALAKVSFLEALKAALTVAPGRISSGDLEVDEGNLIYDFIIVDARQKVLEVEVDAGNGKVLDVDEGDDE